MQVIKNVKVIIKYEVDFGEYVLWVNESKNSYGGWGSLGNLDEIAINDYIDVSGGAEVNGLVIRTLKINKCTVSIENGKIRIDGNAILLT